ncbi:MAG: transcriptional repressor [Persephonella sp.]|nr:MAG: transcriptional repressor [Persephonella sp.]
MTCLENIVKNKFKEYLKEKGLRYTRQREDVLRKILETKGHFEIEDIVLDFKKQSLDVSRSTVYRTLNILKELGIVNEVIKYKNKTLYEVALKEHHDHLVCEKCGRIIEFHSEEIEELQNKICKDYNFKPTFHRLEIYGVCEDCRRGYE